MLVLPDNDVTGIVETLKRVMQSDEWREYVAALQISFTSFPEVGLPRDAPDQEVWQTCQSNGIVLITANRAGGPKSLDEVIAEHGGPDSLPVITFADPQRIRHDGSYAYQAAVQLLDYLDRLDTLRGAARLFIP